MARLKKTRTPRKQASKKAQADQQSKPTITQQDIVAAAAAGFKLLNLESTLIPGNLRRQLDVLEVILQGITSGTLGLVSAPQSPVESGPNAGEKPVA